MKNNENNSDAQDRWAKIMIWSVPLVSILTCCFLGITYIKNLGPKVTIAFTDASGVEPEKTKIRFRGIDIGTVKEVTISEDSKDTMVTARLNRDAKHFAVENTKFWIVSPKVSFQGIAGLDSLVQGVYIGVEPGDPKGETTKTFKGRELSEVTESLENTSVYIIETNTVESISAGNSITYRGLNVGSVSKLTLAKDGKTVYVQAHIENQYVNLIRTNTKFWRKVGVNVDAGLFGANIKLNSIESIMKGGIAIATPDKPGPQAKALAHFPMEKEAPKDFEKWNPSL